MRKGISYNKYQDFIIATPALITLKKSSSGLLVNEVKSCNYRSHSSLDKSHKYFSSVIANSYILYTKDIIIHLPLYIAKL